MTEDESASVAELSAELWPLIAPRLAGRPPVIQSAVLADLTAMWLAGVQVCGTGSAARADLAAIREDLLAAHMDLVRDLIHPNEQILRERMQNALGERDKER